MLKIIEKTKIWFTISLMIIIIGLAFTFVKGLNYSIDFAGGTLLDVNMEKDFNKPDADAIVQKYIPDAETKKVKDSKTIELEIRSKSVSTEKVNEMVSELKQKFNIKTKNPLTSQESLGASVTSESRQKALISVIVASLAMLLYVGIRFEFKFGVAAIIALIHDVLITLGVYAVFQIPVGSSFIAAILTIIGYSINDTIVVFDRIRENQRKMRKNPQEVADISITQTMSRSINTVLTTLFTIVAVNIFVPAVRDFSMPLIIGIISGCYSSIFIASPLWVIFKNMGKKTAAAKVH